MGADQPGDDDVLIVEIERAGTTEVLKAQLSWRQMAPTLAGPAGRAPSNWAEAASAMCFLWETLLTNGQPVELVDDQGVFHVIPAASVLAIRCHRFGPKPGDAQLARQFGFRPPLR
jgi:hypothetical protein